MQKEKEKVIKEAKERGWYLHRQNKHDIYKHKKGGCVTVSRSASERRDWLEIKSHFIQQERLHH